MASPIIDAPLLHFAQFDAYTGSEELPLPPLEAAPKPLAPTPKRKNKVTKKRKRVGRACVFCQRSHMSCDEQRPCKRCVARGCGDQCRDGKRKRRGRKRKTPLPDDEDIDDEFDEFEPLDKLVKDGETDSEEEFEDEHGCNDAAHCHEHPHHHEALAQPATANPSQFNLQLFEDDEESSLSASSNSIPLLKVKVEYETPDDLSSLPSRPTTPALPVPMRNPRLHIIQTQSAAPVSSSPSTNPGFDALYSNFFESNASSCPDASATSSALDVDSFFAADSTSLQSHMPVSCGKSLQFFETTPFGGEETDILL